MNARASDLKEFVYQYEQSYYKSRDKEPIKPYSELKHHLRPHLDGIRTFRGKRVLEICSGQAQYSRLIQHCFFPKKTVAVELFRDRIQKVAWEERGSGVCFVVGDIFHLPFRDRSFDIVFGNLILHHLPPLDRAVLEIHRVLADDGEYIGFEPNFKSPIVLASHLIEHRSKNEYLLQSKDITRFFFEAGFETQVSYFWRRLPMFRNRFLTTLLFIRATKKSKLTVSETRPIHAPVLVATFPPDREGGVLSMTRSFLSFGPFQNHRSLSLIYSNYDRSATGSVRLASLLRGKWRVEEKEENFLGQRAFRIGMRLPYWEPLYYLGNLPEWRRHIQDSQVLQLISGDALPGLALACSRRKFVCWVASTMDEDRKGRYTKSHWLKRLNDLVTRPVLRKMENYILRKSSRILALSSKTASAILEKNSISKDKVQVLHPPVDLQLFQPGKTPLADSLLFVGRFRDPRKNIDFLLRVFSRVLQEKPTARLTIAGDRASKALQHYASRLGVISHVEFIDEIPNQSTVRLYQNAALFVIPSLQEGLCISGIEALACGLPIVSTRCDGPEDYVFDGENGFLVEVGDEQQMADRIVQLIKNESLRAQFSLRSREIAEDKFTVERFGRRLIEVYKDVWPELFASQTP